MPQQDSTQPQDAGVSRAELDRVLAALERAESRLESMELQLNQAERLATLGTLVGAVAHEFNNLLTPIMSYAQLALSAPDDAELTRKALERAYKGAERAARVSATMLGFGRAGNEPSACMVRETLHEAIETARLEAAHERIELVVDVPEDLCAGMACLSLQQVLVNLLLNARRAIGNGGGTITVRASRSTWNHSDHEDACCVIEVGDTGCGIDDDTMATLFTPYQPGPVRNHERGTGLGLSICKRLVDSAGGRIDVESEVGAGTVFRVTLPIGEPSSLKHASASTSAA
ncbi:MAG: ATP-binding protein [Phycisphaerales bacterium]